MENLLALSKLCEQFGCFVNANAPMKNYTTFKIGGPADLLISPYSQEQVKKVICACRELQVPLTVIGNGSNLLVSDSGIRGCVLKIGTNMSAITLEENGVISCLAGAPLSALSVFAMKNSLTGLEFAYGIPGTAGGALFMNAGAYGGEFKDVIVSADHIDSNGNIVTLQKNNMQLAYRSSVYSSMNSCIVSMKLQLSRGNSQDIKAKMDDFMSKRKSKQPLEYPSAGSVFKRPEGYFAGALIEQAGLKGYSVGGAAVSEKHAGFIINKGGASCCDVELLISQIQQKVFENSGVHLECEIKKI